MKPPVGVADHDDRLVAGKGTTGGGRIISPADHRQHGRIRSRRATVPAVVEVDQAQIACERIKRPVRVKVDTEPAVVVNAIAGNLRTARE